MSSSSPAAPSKGQSPVTPTLKRLFSKSSPKGKDADPVEPRNPPAATANANGAAPSGDEAGTAQGTGAGGALGAGAEPSTPPASPLPTATTSSPGTSADPGQAPAAPPPAPSAPTPTTNATVTTSPPAAAAELHPGDADKEKEKDKGSPSTTLTGATHAHSSSPASSRRQANKSAASEGAHSGSTVADKAPANGQRAHSHASPAAPRAKRGLLARILDKLVPCVGPAPAHPVELDPPPPPAAPAAAGPEKAPPPVAEESAETKARAPESLATASETLSKASADAIVAAAAAAGASAPHTRPTTPTPPTTLHITPPSPDAEVDIVVPPTPTKRVLPEDETEGLTSGAVQPPGSTGESLHAHERRTTAHESDRESEGTSFTEDEDQEEQHPAMDEIEDDEERLIMSGGAGIPIGPDGVPRPLLPPVAPQHVGRKCLVLDLDETLVHSSFKSIQQADYVVPVEIEYHWHNVYVIKRPGVDNFLKKMGEIYEVVVFTASLSKYADPVLDKLDIHRVVTHRLFRESCYNHRGNYVKDLSQLGRPIADTIILDNSPASYIFHPNNAVPVSSWFNDPHDTELTDLCPFLTDLATVEDVRGVLDGGL